MSGYRIVLKLKGNASRKIDKLANDLVRADVAASSLARSLGHVAVASHGIAPIHSRGGGGAVRPSPYDREPMYRRHRGTRILSYGTGFNVGGFSGRFSSILQPNAAGKIMGMNANSLMKGANIASLATSIIGSVVKTAAKVIGAATLAPLAIGGGGLALALNALQSEGFKEGVRLISRTRQAKLGLGEDYARGQKNADFLSESYGFDRSTTLSSINVLTGMGIGGTGRKLTTGDATGLTKVGGLIAQQSGVSFERVMTNIQQLLVQTTPHVRDIRELLNQAPILGKYALKDMEAKDVKGVDVRTWLKDTANIMSVMKRYEIDLASNAGMRASGQVSLAKKDLWKTIAGNDKSWEYVGYAGAKVINTIADSLNNLLSAFTSNPAFLVMVERLNVALETAGSSGVSLLGRFTKEVEKFSQQYGIPLGDPREPRIRVDKQFAIQEVLNDEKIKGNILGYADKNNFFKDVPQDVRKEAENLLMMEVLSTVRKDSAILAGVTGVGELRHADAFDSENFFASINRLIARDAFTKQVGMVRQPVTLPDSMYRYKSPVESVFNTGKDSDVANPMAQYAAYDLSSAGIERASQKYIDDVLGSGKVPVGDSSSGEAQGTDLSGFNNDRRALEIHFNAPIVEWTNTMETTSPQETVDAISENIEQLASAAIQKALLGASNKMSSRWY